MSISKRSTILAIVLTIAGAAPAFAHNNLNDWMLMMERLRQQRLTMQPAARAQAVNPTISSSRTTVRHLPTKRLGRHKR